MQQNMPEGLKLEYTIFCDDVRLETGNRLSLMGVIQQIAAAQFPATFLKFGVVNHWSGEAGSYLTEVRILTPDGKGTVAVSQPLRFDITPDGGESDNISFFVQLTFARPGTYRVQTLINSRLVSERPLRILQAEADVAPPSEAVN